MTGNPYYTADTKLSATLQIHPFVYNSPPIPPFSKFHPLVSPIHPKGCMCTPVEKHWSKPNFPYFNTQSSFRVASSIFTSQISEWPNMFYFLIAVIQVFTQLMLQQQSLLSYRYWSSIPIFLGATHCSFCSSLQRSRNLWPVRAK